MSRFHKIMNWMFGNATMRRIMKKNETLICSMNAMTEEMNAMKGRLEEVQKLADAQYALLEDLTNEKEDTERSLSDAVVERDSIRKQLATAKSELIVLHDEVKKQADVIEEMMDKMAEMKHARFEQRERIVDLEAQVELLGERQQ